MANQINAFFERLTARTGAYNLSTVSELSALDAVFLDVKPEAARMGQTIRLYYPDIGEFTDQAANDWVTEDTNPGFVDVPFGQRPGKAILIRDFEQVLTSTNIIEQFIDPAYKRAQEYANAAIFALLTTQNFPTYAPINTQAAHLGVGDAKLAWNILRRHKVPIRSRSDSTILYHTDLHANTLTDTTWYQENLVGALIATPTRSDAALPGTTGNVAFNFTRRDDQQAPTGTAALTGTLSVTQNTAAVVGSGTSFLTQAPAGSWITFGSDTVSYPVSAVADDTHLTLQQSYTGTTVSGGTAVRTTYTGVAMHRYAIALAVRPLEIVNNGQVRSTLLDLKGLPVRVQLSYQHRQSGWLMTFDYVMVCKVIRPDFGILLAS